MPEQPMTTTSQPPLQPEPRPQGHPGYEPTMTPEAPPQAEPARLQPEPRPQGHPGYEPTTTPDEPPQAHARQDPLPPERPEGHPGYEPTPPVEGDTPAIMVNGALSQTAVVGDALTCTQGNWVGEPTSFAYQWKSDGTNIGTDSDSYTVAAGDSGKSITCVVTATNAAGSAAAPPTNAVAVS